MHQMQNVYFTPLTNGCWNIPRMGSKRTRKNDIHRALLLLHARLFRNQRTNLLFQCHPQPQPHSAIQTIIYQVEELTALNNRSVRRFCEGPSPNLASWIAPEAHVIEVNFDATWSASSGKAWAGLIARNANGEFVGAKCLSFHTESEIMAEAIVGFEGCKLEFELASRGIALNMIPNNWSKAWKET